MFEQGDIVRFNYLWARQAKRGEESGRKARPACIVVKSGGNPATLFLLPLTSRPPADGTTGLPVPEMERRRAGLQSPCWVIVDEYNRVMDDHLHDFDDHAPLGRFSLAFLKKVAGALKSQVMARRAQAVLRG